MRLSSLVFIVLRGVVLPAVAQPYQEFADTPLPGPDEPVMAGYDLVEYHNLQPTDDGVPGNPSISLRHNGYLYYFINDANKAKFVGNPQQYLPKYGGFCAWGMAWEWDGWPWAAGHMGPPCGPRDGWAILGDGRLYCSIWRSYQDDFNRKQEAGIAAADARWMDYYGSLEGGPQNNGCYAWNWQECFARSIYNPNATTVPTQEEPTESPTEQGSQQGMALFEEEPVTTWSSVQSVLGDAVTWSWTLQDLATTAPKLVVELVATRGFTGNSRSYVALGVAEQLMQGALIVCSPLSSSVQEPEKASQEVSSLCETLLGAGMGTTKPEQDPVQPQVLLSHLNETHYTVRFSALLLGCWYDPRLPARVLFARGGVSGNGDPQPHLHNALHRQAVAGVHLLQVVQGYNVDENRPNNVPVPALLEPLPAIELWNPIPGTMGEMDILSGRVHVVHQLFQHEDAGDIIRIMLQNVEHGGSEETYVGFGFAQDTMTGLVITCSPRLDNDPHQMLALCQQWRGLGTNLYPRSLTEDAGGWFVTSSDGNATHVDYTLAGRVADVVQGSEGEFSLDHVRAISALGQAAPDSGTPLAHTSHDRVPFQLLGLASDQTSAGIGQVVLGSLVSMTFTLFLLLN